MHMRLLANLAVVILTMGLADTGEAASGPICPTAGSNPIPDYGTVAAEPKSAVWKNIRLSADSGCAGISDDPAELVVALAGTFASHGSVQALADRIGAISGTKGMMYWSVTDQRMRVLIDESYALSGTTVTSRRRDFSADEVLSGRRLFFAQDDTRSTGINVYSLKTASADANHVTFDVINETPIKVGPVTLFAPRMVRSRHFFHRISDNSWRYYGVTVIEHGLTFGMVQSLVNRGIALYNHLSR
jgi:Family of unknown function (DUF6675)